MPNKKLSQIPPASSINGTEVLVGVRDNGDGTFTDYTYPATSIAGMGRKRIIVPANGDTLTDPFFANTITEIIADNQVYISVDDFTQSGTTITGVTISFTSGQKIIAKL
jgi:hypothetical protein